MFEKKLIVVKAGECEDWTHKCEIECPICHQKIKGHYGCYTLKNGTKRSAAWYTNFPRHCSDLHANVTDLKKSRKRSLDTSEVGQKKMFEIFQKVDKMVIEESIDEPIEIDSDDEPLVKKKKTRPIEEDPNEDPKENSGEH